MNGHADDAPHPDTTGQRHCYHQLVPVYGLSIAGAPPVVAVPELCCWCAPVRLTVYGDAPEGAAEHGPSIRFVGLPKTAPAPRPTLVVPNGPRLVH